MANLNETAQWVHGIYQIETDDPVLGGPEGVINIQAKQLADRTAFLKQAVEDAADVAAGADAKADDALAQIAQVKADAGSAAASAAAALQHRNAAQAAEALATAAKDAAEAASAQAGDNANYAVEAAGLAQQKASEAQAAATAAVSASGVATAARDAALQAKNDTQTIRDGAVAARTVAETKASEATQAATTATTQAAVATTQASTATSARSAAEAARDAAFVNANVFATEAAGRAAVADGQQFQVVSADGMSILRYRRDSSSASTLMATYPSKALFDNAFDTGYDRSGYAWAILDSAGRMAAFVDNSGKFGTPKFPDHGTELLRLSGAVCDFSSRSGYAWAVVDPNDRVAFGLSNAGELILKGFNFGSILNQNLPTRLTSIETRLTSIEKFITPSTTNIVCWGDSLTQGAGGGGTTYPGHLATLSGRTVSNRGLGGQSSNAIIARQGGNGVTVTVSGNSIPASGGVAVTAISIDLLKNAGGSGSIAGSLCGVAGTLSWTTGGGYVFTRTTAGSAVTCYAGSIFTPTTGDDLFYLPVFWLGRNQFNYSQTASALQGQVDNVKLNLAAAISTLKPVDKRFIILGVSSGSNSFEFVGTDNYNAKRTLAADLARLYPNNFIDIDTILVNSGTGTGQDLTDFNNGIVPSSLRSDSQHLNATGYQIVAQAVYNHILQKGW